MAATASTTVMVIFLPRFSFMVALWLVPGGALDQRANAARRPRGVGRDRVRLEWARGRFDQALAVAAALWAFSGSGAASSEAAARMAFSNSRSLRTFSPSSSFKRVCLPTRSRRK